MIAATTASNPLIPAPDPTTLAGTHPLTVTVALLGTLVLTIVIASVYKWTHRGLSYSQTFQFSLVLLGMLASAIMMVAGTGIVPAVGILAGFSLIRFRTPVKDPKDMAYILFVLVVGLAMGAKLYYLAAIVTAILSLVVIVLTRVNFGLTAHHESILRLMCVAPDTGPVDAERYEAILRESTDSWHLLSAVGHGNRMELTYGVRPRRGSSTFDVLAKLQNQPAVEHAEVFDTKHQVEF